MVLIKALLTAFIVSLLTSILATLLNLIVKFLKNIREVKESYDGAFHKFLSELELQNFERDFVQNILSKFSIHNGILNQDGILIRYAREKFRDQLSIGRICYLFESDLFGEDEEDLERLHSWSVDGERYFLCFTDGSIEEVPYSIRTSILEQKELSVKGDSVSDQFFGLSENRREALICVIKQEIYISGYLKENSDTLSCPVVEDAPHAEFDFIFYHK